MFALEEFPFNKVPLMFAFDDEFLEFVTTILARDELFEETVV